MTEVILARVYLIKFNQIQCYGSFDGSGFNKIQSDGPESNEIPALMDRGPIKSNPMDQSPIKSHLTAQDPNEISRKHQQDAINPNLITISPG